MHLGFNVFGVDVTVFSTEMSIPDHADMEAADEQEQITYTNAWLAEGGYETYEVFEQGTNARPRDKAWWRL